MSANPVSRLPATLPAMFAAYADPKERAAVSRLAAARSGRTAASSALAGTRHERSVSDATRARPPAICVRKSAEPAYATTTTGMTPTRTAARAAQSPASRIVRAGSSRRETTPASSDPSAMPASTAARTSVIT